MHIGIQKIERRGKDENFKKLYLGSNLDYGPLLNHIIKKAIEAKGNLEIAKGVGN